MRDFKLSELMWKETLIVNLVRAFVAGFVWMIFLYVTGAGQNQNPGPWFAMIAWPVGYFLFFLPVGILASWLNKLGLPWIGLISFIPAIMMVPADPLVSILHKIKPELVPVKKYNFIEPAMSIWVYRDNQPDIYVQEKINEEENSSLSDACPFTGHILVDKTTHALGLEWPAKATAFIINEDWSVETSSDRKYGWIDINGEIHKGISLGGIRPHEILSGGNTGVKIDGDHCWIGNDKIGDLVRS